MIYTQTHTRIHTLTSYLPIGALQKKPFSSILFFLEKFVNVKYTHIYVFQYRQVLEHTTAIYLQSELIKIGLYVYMVWYINGVVRHLMTSMGMGQRKAFPVSFFVKYIRSTYQIEPIQNMKCIHRVKTVSRHRIFIISHSFFVGRKNDIFCFLFNFGYFQMNFHFHIMKSGNNVHIYNTYIRNVQRKRELKQYNGHE